MRPSKDELRTMSPEFDNRWESYFANAPDKPVMLFLTLNAYAHSFLLRFILNRYSHFANRYAGQNPAVPRGKYFSVAYFSVRVYPLLLAVTETRLQGYPASTGTVHITAGLDPYGKLDFHPGYLDE